ncbi:MAG: M12 family metallo-peptidase, partial [Patescibacteria group bacterium]
MTKYKIIRVSQYLALFIVLAVYVVPNLVLAAPTASVSPTGNPYIDGILAGVKWGTTSLTYSFPATADLYGSNYANGEQLNNFKAFTTIQQDVARLINTKFSETTETLTTHGVLRYAESDSPSTAFGYYPSTSEVGGDSWYNNIKHYYDTPVRGNYAYLTMMHETGHNMGLKHAHEASGSFAAMPVDRDSLEYTVMSYKSYIGGSATSGYTNGSGSYPQTRMMYDIAALQTMYGADFTDNAGDTVYSWSPSTGQTFINGVAEWIPAANKIFMT